MGEKNILIWVLFLAVFIWCIYWHISENKQLTEKWQKKFDADSSHDLIRFAWSRTFQVLTALGLCLLVFIGYDWQLSEARKNIETINSSPSKNPVQLSQVNNNPSPAIEPAPVPTSPTTSPKTAGLPVTANVTPVSPLSPASAPAGYYPPIINPSEAPPDTTAKSGQGASMDEVYNPEKDTHDTQSSIDSTKKRYEDILVTFQFLKKCGKTTPQEHNLIIAALGKELASLNAPANTQHDIVSAANGSFKEIYSQSSCDGPDINTLYGQYSNYIKGLSSAQPVQ